MRSILITSKLRYTTGSTPGGELTIGGVDLSHVNGSFTNVSVVQPLQYWTMKFSA